MPINNVGGPGPTSGNPISDAAHEHVATVRHGETVSDVARRHGVETRSLLEANPQLKDAYQTLNAGQEIRLPQGSTADHSDFKITKHVDAASAKLNEAATFAPAPLTDPTTRGVIRDQLSTTSRLSEADLAQVQGGIKGESTADKHKDLGKTGSTELPTEAVSLNFGKIEVTYKPQKTDGTLDTLGSNVTAKYDLKQSKGA